MELRSHIILQQIGQSVIVTSTLNAAWGRWMRNGILGPKGPLQFLHWAFPALAGLPLLSSPNSQQFSVQIHPPFHLPAFLPFCRPPQGSVARLDTMWSREPVVLVMDKMNVGVGQRVLYEGKQFHHTVVVQKSFDSYERDLSINSFYIFLFHIFASEKEVR